jgi:lipid II:glycine glycyltransferase (peptidoglycan interpeptide bridge formation enzyme)
MFRAAFAQYTKEERSSVLPYRTILLDLTYPIEVLRERLSPRWRRQLLRAERNALRIRMGDTAEDFRTFQPLYSQMRRRKGFHSTVSVEEFARIQQGLPERHRMKVLLCEEEGRLVAGIVVSVMGETALYLLGATSEQGLNSRGSYLLHWTLIEWLGENGVRYYDLGGINPESNPGGYDFKKGFSGADASHLAPYSACDSFFSGAFVRTGDAVRSAIREGDRWIHRARGAIRAGGLQC